LIPGYGNAYDPSRKTTKTNYSLQPPLYQADEEKENLTQRAITMLTILLLAAAGEVALPYIRFLTG